MGVPRGGVEPVAETQKALERVITQQQEPGAPEPPGIGDQIPVAGKPAEPLQRGEVQQVGTQDVIRGMGIVSDAEGLGMPADGRAPQALKDADLDFVGIQGRQPVEALAEARQILPRQAGDQVGMEVGVGMVAQPGQVLFGFPVILPVGKCRLLARPKRT